MAPSVLLDASQAGPGPSLTNLGVVVGGAGLTGSFGGEVTDLLRLDEDGATLTDVQIASDTGGRWAVVALLRSSLGTTNGLVATVRLDPEVGLRVGTFAIGGMEDLTGIAVTVDRDGTWVVAANGRSNGGDGRLAPAFGWGELTRAQFDAAADNGRADLPVERLSAGGEPIEGPVALAAVADHVLFMGPQRAVINGNRELVMAIADLRADEGAAWVPTVGAGSPRLVPSGRDRALNAFIDGGSARVGEVTGLGTPQLLPGQTQVIRPPGTRFTRLELVSSLGGPSVWGTALEPEGNPCVVVHLRGDRVPLAPPRSVLGANCQALIPAVAVHGEGDRAFPVVSVEPNAVLVQDGTLR